MDVCIFLFIRLQGSLYNKSIIYVVNFKAMITRSGNIELVKPQPSALLGEDRAWTVDGCTCVITPEYLNTYF